MDKHIISFLFIIWIAGVIIFYITFKSIRLYCFVFKHKDYKLWNKICKHLKEAKLIDYKEDNNITTICLIYRLVIDSINYDIIYWCKENIVSVHLKDKCILSDFDKYHSYKAAKIINEYLL